MSDRDIAARAARIAAPVFDQNEWHWGKDSSPPDEAAIAARVMDDLNRFRSDPELAWTRSGRFRLVRDVEDGCKPEIYVLLELADDVEGSAA